MYWLSTILQNNLTCFFEYNKCQTLYRYLTSGSGIAFGYEVGMCRGGNLSGDLVQRE